MELRQLKHFLTVGEEGSITAAARKLRLTQPALSRQIKALEEELDTVLLERGAHSVTLTPAGELLVAESRKLLKFADGMTEKVKATAAGEPLRVGYSPSLAGEFLSLAIQRFTQFHPKARVSLFDESSLEMRTRLIAGKLDVILTAPCVGISEPVRWVPLKSYGWQLVMAAGHPLAEKKIVTTKDLDGQRLLLFDRQDYPDYWDRVTGFFRERDLQAKVAGEFDGMSSLGAAVEANLGIAFISTSSKFDRERQRLVSRPLQEEPARIDVAAGMSTSVAERPPVLAFIEELKKAAIEC